MSAFSDFRLWVWSDWGRPSFLTRMGFPRIVTNLLAFVLYFIALAYLQWRYVSPNDKAKVHLFLHNPFILAAFAVFYIGYVLREFLSFKYKLKGRALDKVMRQNWGDPFVKLDIFALGSMLLLFLIGFLWYRFQLK